MAQADLMDLLDVIDSTAEAIGDVVTLMLGNGERKDEVPGGSVLHRLHGLLREELDELGWRLGRYE